MTDYSYSPEFGLRRRVTNLPRAGSSSNFFNVSEHLASQQVVSWEPVDAEQCGEVITPPIVSWMLEYGDFRRFIQYLWVTVPPEITTGGMETVLQAVLDRHQMLRAQLDPVDGGYQLSTRPPGSVRAADILTQVRAVTDDALASHVASVVNDIDPCSGAVVRALWCHDPGPDSGGKLLLVVHHLAADVVSWYVLGAGLTQAWEQLSKAENVILPSESTSYREWSRLMEKRSRADLVHVQRDYWLAQLAGPDPALGSRMPDPRHDTWASQRAVDVVIDVYDTRLMLDMVASVGRGIGVREFLLAALTMTVMSWRLRRGNAPAPSDEGVLLHMESHGREDTILDPHAVARGAGVDTSTTVGWFTQIFPVRLGAGHRLDVDTVRDNPDAARTLLRAVGDCLDAIPNNGLDYGLLRYQRRDPDIASAPHPQVIFNYIGRLDLAQPAVGSDQNHHPGAAAPWSLVTDSRFNGSVPAVPEPGLPLRYVFDVAAMLRGTADGPELVAHWRWSDKLTTDEEAAELTALWRDAVTTLVRAL